MQGKNQFSAADVEAIRKILRKLRSVDRSEQKKLRGILRGQYEFFITDFDTSGKGFTESDFNTRIEKGVIRVQETT